MGLIFNDMAGIYIHIPFCKKKCYYCNFYKSVVVNKKEDFLQSLKKEILQRKEELQEEEIETIYFGGGTPSLLTIEEIEDVLNTVFKNFSVSENAEITFESNPDDLTYSYLKKLSETPVNRLSIGIQSFKDSDLILVNRRHRSDQAIKAVKDAQNAGFNNISIDLIYGLPKQTMEEWKRNIEITLSLNVQHISSYCLTYSKGTVFYKRLQTGKLRELSDDLCFSQFKYLVDRLKEDGFEQYEISNFSKPGYRSAHNSSYWLRKKYLGFGPSAHSYDFNRRRWNKADLDFYIKNVNENNIYWEDEILDTTDRYNDYMITSLRTIWGISEDILISDFGERYLDFFKKGILSYIKTGHIISNNGNYSLTTDGLFISDMIMEDLLYVD